jgi:hypothetical protein
MTQTAARSKCRAFTSGLLSSAWPRAVSPSEVLDG